MRDAVGFVTRPDRASAINGKGYAGDEFVTCQEVGCLRNMLGLSMPLEEASSTDAFCILNLYGRVEHDWSRQDAIDADRGIAGRQFHRHGSHDGFDGTFPREVGAEVPIRPSDRPISDEYNRTTRSLGHHLQPRAFRDRIGTQRVDLEIAPHVVAGGLLEFLPFPDRRAVHRRIEAPKARDDRTNLPFHSIHVADIALRDHAWNPFLSPCMRHTFRLLRGSVRMQGNAIVFPREMLSDGASDTGSAAPGYPNDRRGQ